MRMDMKHFAPAALLLAPAALLLSLACQPRPTTPIYGPWEEGLTLVFENPSLPQPQRSEERLQLRVARSPLTPGAPKVVQLDLASTRGHMSLLARHQDGGVAIVGEDGRELALVLPAGFPTQGAWAGPGIECRVIGRATWTGASILPATSDPVGVWIEARLAQGLRRRTLYLPNLGEVEAQEERDGGWITVNRLVARGFMDLPTSKRP